MPGGFADNRAERIAAEAAKWNSRMLEPASQAEVEQFEAWLRADPANAKAYAQVASLSELAERLPRHLSSPERARTRPLGLRPAFGVAAALLLTFAGALWLYTGASTTAQASISNPGPAARGVRLSDGSAIILDAGADLSVTFDGGSRSVTLRSGRARFDAVSDDDRPFSVRAAQAVVTARGTLFDVAFANGEIRVWAIHGDVFVAATGPSSSRAQPVRLEAGQALRIHDGVTTAMPIEPDAVRWPAGRLAFDRTPLSAVVALANRRGSPKIELGDAAIGSLEVTGVLDIRKTRPLARKLAAALELTVEERADSLLLTR